MPRAINYEVRERIVATAYGLFFESGYKSVSMDDIARATGLKKANLFHYYPTKETLGLAVLDRADAEFKQQIESDLCDEAPDPIDAVLQVLRRAADVVAKGGRDTPSVVGNIVVEMSSQPGLQEKLAQGFGTWHQAQTKFLNRWKNKGYFSAEFDPAKASATLISLIQGVSVYWNVCKDPSVFCTVADYAKTTLETYKK